MEISLSNAGLFLGTAIASSGIAYVWTWLVSRPVVHHLRHRQEVHWTETARLIHPHLEAVGIVVAGLPGALALAVHFGLHHGLASSIGIGLLAHIGACLGTRPMGSALRPADPLDIKQLLLSPSRHPVIIYGLILLIMPSQLGPGAIALFLLCVGWSLFKVIRPMGMLRLAHGFSPAPANISRIAHDWANRMGATLRGIWIAETSEAGAWAFCVSREILLTRGIVRQLSEAELESILIHEMEHLRESPKQVLGRVIGSIYWLPILLLKPIHGSQSMVGFFLIVLWLVALPRLLGRMATRMEIKADGASANSNPATLARALIRIHESNLIPASMKPNSPHPCLYDRLLAIGITPDFPRPKNPAGMPAGAIISLVLLLLLMIPALMHLPNAK